LGWVVRVSQESLFKPSDAPLRVLKAGKMQVRCTPLDF
jgi:hypothetical protein